MQGKGGRLSWLRSPRAWLALGLVLGTIAPATSVAGPGAASAILETEPNFNDEEGGFSDADDPAIWINASNPQRSLVFGTLKDGGLAAYDLTARRLQKIPVPPPPAQGAPGGRFNNVDVISGFPTPAGPADVTVTSDRGRDQLRIHAIDPSVANAGLPPLTDVTVANPPFVFSRDQAEVNEQATAYGLTGWKSSATGSFYAFVSQRRRTMIAMMRLVAAGGGVTYEKIAAMELPSTFTLANGARWTPCEIPGDLPQVEGMVVDDDNELLYAAQEDVGIWQIRISDYGFGVARLIDTVREFGVPERFDPGSGACVAEGPDPGFGRKHLARDVEGLTIYEATDGGGYLIASSQGDSTFALYDRRGRGSYVGSFALTDGAVDGVQESDGADVTSMSLGESFRDGLLVTHDGRNTPEVIGPEGKARENTNFKFTRWADVARFFDPSHHWSKP